MRIPFAFVPFLALAACGGDSGSRSIVDSSPNSAPTITSSGNFTVNENISQVGTVQASDADGDTLTFSLSGTDAAIFSISSSGVLSFDNAPDFENPADDNGDNVYDLTVTVSDGTHSVDQSITVTVTDEDDEIAVTYIGTVCSGHAAMRGVPGSSDLVIACNDGRVLRYDPDAKSAVTLLDYSNDPARPVTGVPWAVHWVADSLYVGVFETNGNYSAYHYNISGGTPNLQVQIAEFSAGTSAFEAIGAWIGDCEDGVCLTFGDDALYAVDLGSANAASPNDALTMIVNLVDNAQDGDILDGVLYLATESDRGIFEVDPAGSLIKESGAGGAALHFYTGPVQILKSKALVSHFVNGFNVGVLQIIPVEDLMDGVVQPIDDYGNESDMFTPGSQTLDFIGAFAEAGGRTFMLDRDGGELFEIVGQ